MLKQKLEYIHFNPVMAGLFSLPEEYKYSSARFYETAINDWKFITHYQNKEKLDGSIKFSRKAIAQKRRSTPAVSRRKHNNGKTRNIEYRSKNSVLFSRVLTGRQQQQGIFKKQKKVASLLQNVLILPCPLSLLNNS